MSQRARVRIFHSPGQSAAKRAFWNNKCPRDSARRMPLSFSSPLPGESCTQKPTGVLLKRVESIAAARLSKLALADIPAHIEESAVTVVQIANNVSEKMAVFLSPAG